MEAGTVQLPTGSLSYQGSASNSAPLTDLCEIGARRNPKRGFVFVSKVLGKHWPSRPSQMLAVHHQLARQIPTEGEAPVLFVGMAETATGLGHAVFEAFLEQNPGRTALFLQTTRYPLQGAARIDFQEEHSHATQQFLYLPPLAAHQDLLSRVGTAVLVDDEATSGKTFVNLSAALCGFCPSLHTVVPLVLTDFTEWTLPVKLKSVPGIQHVIPVSLWRGTYDFTRDTGVMMYTVPAAFAQVGCRRNHISEYTGRLGLDSPIAIPFSMIEHCASFIDRPRVLVVGTGECMHPAFRLALALETRAFDVRVQSTTRSPLMQAGAIADVTHVSDPYGEGIPNYLYNLSMSSGARVVVVHETRERAHVDELIRQLDAIEFDLAGQRVESSPKQVHQ